MSFLDLEPAKESDPKKDSNAPPKTVTPTPEPGFAMPGSKTDALLRSFGTAATLGLAPKISAGLQSLVGDGDYKSYLQQYLADNRNAAAAQPVASGVGALAGNIAPALVTGGGSLPAQIGKAAAMSGAEAGFTSENTGMELAKDVTLGAGIGAATASALPVAKAVGGRLLDIFRGSNNPSKLADATVSFANRSEPPLIKGTAAERQAVEDVWAKIPNDGISSQWLEDVIKNNPSAINTITKDPNALKTIIDAHNQGISVSQVVKNLALPTLGGGVTTGLAAGYGSDWNPEIMIGSAGAGALVGAATGGRGAIRNETTKLRLPEIATPSTLIGDATKSMITQSAARDIKEQTGVSTSPFGKLSDYLNMASGSTNPEVNSVAAKAQAILNESDPDQRRKLAMELSADMTGRAVTNGESPVRK